MVFIGNIFKVHEDLTDKEEIVLKYGGDLETSIFAEDTVEKMNGDLKISRKHNNAIIVADCAEIKYFIVRRRFL